MRLQNEFCFVHIIVLVTFRRCFSCGVQYYNSRFISAKRLTAIFCYRALDIQDLIYIKIRYLKVFSRYVNMTLKDLYRFAIARLLQLFTRSIIQFGNIRLSQNNSFFFNTMRSKAKISPVLRTRFLIKLNFGCCCH